jgi:hypothetical protein
MRVEADIAASVDDADSPVHAALAANEDLEEEKSK